MLERHKFLLFTQNSTRANNPLRDVLLFLKKSHLYLSYKFNYAPATPNLINNLTLKENILLESIPITLCSNREFQLEEYLQKTNNEALVKLFNRLNLINLYPNKSDLRTQKIAMLVKCFIKESPVLILESPDLHLDELDQELLKQAILIHKNQNPKQLVVISEKEETRWNTIVPALLTHKSRGIFEISSNPQAKKLDKFFEQETSSETKTSTQAA